jgi:PAS domain S-box-containing protein
VRRLLISLKRIFSLIVVLAIWAVLQSSTSSTLPGEIAHAAEEIQQSYPVQITQIRLQGYSSSAEPSTLSQAVRPSSQEQLSPNIHLSEYAVVKGSSSSAIPNDITHSSNDGVQSYPTEITQIRLQGYSSSAEPTLLSQGVRVSSRERVSPESNLSKYNVIKDNTSSTPPGDIAHFTKEINQSSTDEITQLSSLGYSSSAEPILLSQFIKVSSQEPLSPGSNLSDPFKNTHRFRLVSGSDSLMSKILIILSLLFVCLLILIYMLIKTIHVRRNAQRSEKRFKVLLEASPSAVMIFQNFKLKFANTSLELLTGYTREELITMEIWQLIHPESLKELNRKDTPSYKNGTSFRAELKIITKSLEKKWVDFSTRSIKFDNQPYMLATAIDITEKKKYEQQLIEAEERYSLILMASNDGIFDYNIADNELYLSPQWKEMLGYFDDELGGNLIEWINLIDPDDRMEVNNLLEKLKNGTTTSATIEYRMYCRDGSFKWVWASFSVIFNLDTPHRILGTHSDITERKTTEEMLKESEFRYKSLFSKNSAVMLITDPETGKIQDINQAAVNYYGYDRASLMRMNISDISILSKDLMQKENIQAEKEKRSFRYSQHRLADGNIRDVEIYSSKIPVKSGIMEYSIIFDITERKKIEKELQKAKETAEEAFRTKSYFISNVSHEIRTPLNAIVGLTDLIIQDENLTTALLENIKSIKYSSDHLLNVINDVLDFSKLEAGRVQIETTEFDVHNLVKETAQTINFRAKEKDITVNISVGADVPRILIGDPSRLRQILLNLLGNAIKFTIEGHIDIDVKPINESEDKIDLRFSISDTGIGIPESKLEKIFESFSQAETDTSRKFGGTGLGLTICRKLVELQGGTMGVKSLEGMGSTFWFDLTYEISQRAYMPDKTRGTATMKNLRGIKILLVEDDKMNQFVMSQIMKKWLAQIDIVNNGIQAIQKLEQKKYNLVLMDLHMPELNGYETTKVIRNPDSNVQDHDVPIIALTADVSIETRERVEQSGMNDFITKPSSQDEMYEKIMQVVINSKTKFVEKKTTPEDHEIKESREPDERTKNRIKKALADIFDEDMEGTLGLINRFLKEIPKTIVGINESFYDNDFETLGALVHRIKPGYSYMGFREVSEKIDKIQILAKRKTNPQELERLCIELDDDSRKIIKILREIRAEYLRSNSVDLPPRI